MRRPPPAASLDEPLAMPAVDTEGLSLHFRRWLEQQNLTGWNFSRDDLAGGSFGGNHRAEDPIRHQPVVFIHGNSDRAVGQQDGVPLGWSTAIRYFLNPGTPPVPQSHQQPPVFMCMVPKNYE